MPKTTRVDMHALLDAAEAERSSRSCPSLRVYRFGPEPGNWHELPENLASGDNARFLQHRLPRDRALESGAAPSSVLHLASSTPDADRLGTPRSRSPHRVSARPDSGPASGSPLLEWAGHFDGVVRPFHHGFVLGVDDAVVDEGVDRRRSLFVNGFADNHVLSGERILEACLRRHLDGHRWERVVDLWDALRDVALVEYRHGSAGALALLRE